MGSEILTVVVFSYVSFRMKRRLISIFTGEKLRLIRTYVEHRKERERDRREGGGGGNNIVEIRETPPRFITSEVRGRDREKKKEGKKRKNETEKGRANVLEICSRYNTRVLKKRS